MKPRTQEAMLVDANLLVTFGHVKKKSMSNEWLWPASVVNAFGVAGVEGSGHPLFCRGESLLAQLAELKRLLALAKNEPLLDGRIACIATASGSVIIRLRRDCL